MNRLFLNGLFAFLLMMFGSKSFADTPPPASPPPAETVEQVKAAFTKREEELKAEIESLKKGKGKEGDPPEGDLVEKAKREREEKDKLNASQGEVERAVKFNLTIDQFAKDNKDFLPEDVGGILTQAAKEKYGSEFEKASALKTAIMKTYFSLQANLDSLTPSQKKSVDNWLALTPKGREEKSADMYDNVFEPCIDTVRRVKKAEEVSRARSGLATPTEAAEIHKKKIMDASMAAHLRVKPT